MHFPESHYPEKVWDGSSPTRHGTDTDPVQAVYREPDGADWAQMTGEVIEMQKALGANQAVSASKNTEPLDPAATEGHGYIPTCAGQPTGVPTSKAGFAAYVYDTNEHKLWIYDNGWKSAGALL